MLCPACQVDLHMTERQGVEIDYCPKCRGVWLDRGELDKILERSRQEQVPAAAPPPTAAPGQPPPVQYGQPAHGQVPPPQPGQGYYRDGRYWRDEREYKKHRKKSFFEEIFD